MVHKYSSNGTCDDETIEVRHEQIAAGLPVLLQVRRGSESALNQLLPDTTTNNGHVAGLSPNDEQCKRWSAAAPLSQESKERYISKRDNGLGLYQKKWTYVEEDENEERDLFPPRRTRSSVFSREGNNRLSMQFTGDTAGGLKWADAADRVTSSSSSSNNNNRVFSLSLPREHRKKEPLSQANSNPVPVSSPPTNDVKNQYERVEYIVLKMDDEALGIHVVPDYDHSGRDRGLLVQRIEIGGKVDRDGRLSVNDRIIEINDKNLLNQPFNTVQEIFRDSLKSRELRLRVLKYGGSGAQISSSNKSPPVPVYPKSTKYSHNKENEMVAGEEKTPPARCSKIATVSSTKKAPSVPSYVGAGNILMTMNTRKIGRKVDIELVKGPHGLGFSITTRDNPVGGNCPIYIKNILPKGAAIEDGRLKPGDRLLSINGNDVTGKTQSQVVSELRNIPAGGKVNLLLSRQEDVVTKSEESSEAYESPVICSTVPAVSPNKPNKLEGKNMSRGVDQSSIFPWRQKEILTFDIPVHDTEKAGLGISVKGKTSTAGANNKHGSGGNGDSTVDMGIFINSILNGGAASRDGRLRMNDQLLNVNGVSLLGQSNSAAMDTLRRAILHTEGPKPGAITLSVARKINSVHNKQRRGSSISLLTDSSGTETFGRTEVDAVPAAVPSTSTDNSGNSEISSENTVIFVSPKSQQRLSSPPEPPPVALRNPVLERLTGQIPNINNNLRNESYYRATGHTTMMYNIGKELGDRLTSPTVNQSSNDMVIIEEDPETPTLTLPTECDNNGLPGQQRGSTSTQTTDATYCSQLSLDDAAAGFSRDAFGRQSMSEKRHATLDAKSTDTYQRNKKVREERKHQKSDDRLVNGMIKVNSTESIPHSDQNDIQKNQLGPSLGMKKSSSLESLQTMVQEMQMAEDCGVYRRTQAPVRVIRGRGCNESFRAAVDRSYVSPYQHNNAPMDSVPEDDGCLLSPRQSSLNSQLDCKLIKQNHPTQKKKSSLLRGLGSMFRFGRHRKPTVLDGPASHLGVSSRSPEEEKELGRRAMIEEQQRIQEQYKILMQRQRELQHQQQQHQRVYNQQFATRELPSSFPNVSNSNHHDGSGGNIINIEHVRNERMWLRIQQQHHPPVPQHQIQQPPPPPPGVSLQHQPQLKHTGRNHHQLPSEIQQEELYNDMARRSLRQSEFEPHFYPANRLSGRRVYAPDVNNRYSHYVNYEEIQQQLSRKQQHYHSQRRDNRELHHRPVSNFYEYESVQAMIQNYGMVPPNYASQPPQSSVDVVVNNGASTLPRINDPASTVTSHGPPSNRNYQQRFSSNNSSNHNYPSKIGSGSVYQKSSQQHQQLHHQSPPFQYNRNSMPIYSNITPPTKKPHGPYITQVTIKDHHHHYNAATGSLGTKV